MGTSAGLHYGHRDGLIAVRGSAKDMRASGSRAGSQPDRTAAADNDRRRTVPLTGSGPVESADCDGMEEVEWNRTPPGARPHTGRKRKKNDGQQPDSLRVITTRAGRGSASSRLLTRNPGGFLNPVSKSWLPWESGGAAFGLPPTWSLSARGGLSRLNTGWQGSGPLCPELDRSALINLLRQPAGNH
jgi:hypothetical protein